MTLKDSIWDSVARGADTLRIEDIAADDDAVTYRVSFDLVLKRETHRLIGRKAGKDGRTMASTLRRIVRLAFKICLSDETAEGKSPPRGDDQAIRSTPSRALVISS